MIREQLSDETFKHASVKLAISNFPRDWYSKAVKLQSRHRLGWLIDNNGPPTHFELATRSSPRHGIQATCTVRLTRTRLAAMLPAFFSTIF